MGCAELTNSIHLHDNSVLGELKTQSFKKRGFKVQVHENNAVVLSM